jgi:16S rRNA (guanine(966)-N(2))-methyltransferase RsmD
MKVLDLFAGSGALGIEALSRGAAHCLFVDSSRAACQLIGQNLRATGFLASATVWCKDIHKALSALQADGSEHDLILLDPPYGKVSVAPVLQAISQGAGVGQTALVVFETASTDQLATDYDNLVLADRRVYGSTSLWFFRYHRPH